MDLAHARPARPTRRVSFFGSLLSAFTLRRQRRLLGELDRHILKDIGLTETEARIEADRKLWDVPAHWRR